MTFDEARFEATRRAADVYCAAFQEHGSEFTVELIRAVLDASRGALVGVKGEAFGYHVFSGIADDIAASMIDQRSQGTGV